MVEFTEARHSASMRLLILSSLVLFSLLFHWVHGAYRRASIDIVILNNTDIKNKYWPRYMVLPPIPTGLK